MANQLDPSVIIAVLEYGDRDNIANLKQLILDDLSNNKEAWLIHILVDAYIPSYSLKCAEILHTVREPHDKQLLDRLNDHLKGSEKLPALSLLGHLILKQPPWLHLALNHTIFSTLLKCLKSESDVPILVTALLCLTALIPVDPVKSATYFNDLFEVFQRIIFLVHQKPVNVSEIYLQHLEQTVNSYFYRLYGMFPCNFLVSLRTMCSRPDYSDMVNQNVMPLVEKVRMHPLLISSSKEKEFAKERWKQKDLQDIVVECAKFSLDPTECGAMDSYPFASFSTNRFASSTGLNDSLLMSNAALQLDMEKHTGIESLPSGESLAKSFVNSGRPFSTVPRTGLTTPPLHASITSTDTGISSSSQQGTQSNTPVRTTPFGGSSESSTTAAVATVANEEQEKHVANISEKRNSGLHLSISSKMTTPIDNSLLSESSVPPSPYKQENYFELPAVSSAIRKISFEQSPVSTMCLKNPMSPDQTSSGHKLSSVTSVTSPISVPNSEPSSSGSVHISKAHKPLATAPSTGPTMSELPNFIDSLGAPTEDADDEVSVLTGSSVDAMTYEVQEETTKEDVVTPITSEAVAAFMKKMNRIRFNSMNFSSTVTVSKKPIENITEFKFMRSKSCPDLALEEEYLNSESKCTYLIASSKSQISSASQADSNKRCTPNIKTTENENSENDKHIVHDAQEDQKLAVAKGLVLPYEHLLPPSQRSCTMCGGSLLDGRLSKGRGSSFVSPLYSADTSAVLSQYVEVGSKLCSDLLSQKHGNKGNLPAVADDLATLKGQVLMLQNQVLFERHRREMHTKRNRGQLRHILNATKLEIENTNLKTQLLKKDDENRNLMANVRWLEQQVVELKKMKENQELSSANNIKILKSNLEAMTSKNCELQTALDNHAKEKEMMNKQSQQLSYELFTLQNEIKALQERADASKQLQEQVVHLNKELLLMGELQQKYQQRLATMAASNNSKPELQFLLDACRQELAVTKQQLEQKILRCDALKARISDLDDCMRKKDEVLTEYKRLLDDERQEHCAKLTSLEEHCNGQRKIQVALHGHILQLYGEIGQLKKPSITQHGGSSSNVSVTTSQDEVTGVNKNTSND